MPDFADLRDFLEEPVLRMPIGGRAYEVRPVTAQVWLTLQSLAQDIDQAQQSGKNQIENLTEMDVYKLSLGATYDEMVPHVTAKELSHAGLTAYFWQLGNDSLVEAMWTPEGKAAAAPPPPPAPSTRGSGAARTTRNSTSTSGTTSRRKSSSKPKPSP